eukprot:m.39684 g.39684  ORF g.39684 m.39684 type:complete len:91 (+) comp14744_c0_seq5:1697-1969(+)
MLLVFAHQRAVVPQAGASGHRRSKPYDALKKEWLDHCLEVMYTLFPRTKGKVVYADIGSPLSNEYYYNRAASYGTVCSRCVIRPMHSAGL